MDGEVDAVRHQELKLRGWNLLRWYGAWGTVRLLLDILHTRLRFPGARLVRRPAYVRGRQWIAFGRRLTTGPGVRLDALPQQTGAAALLTIGDDVQMNDSVHIGAAHSIRIGNRVLLASKVFITDHNHGTYSGSGVHSDPTIAPESRALSTAPVVLEDDVWVGEFVAILPGVTIGKGSVIGSMSVVNRDIPAYSIAVGSPARVIKRYNFQTARWEPV